MNLVLFFRSYMNGNHCTKNDVFHVVLQQTADLVTFTEEILNGKLHFLCSEYELDV